MRKPRTLIGSTALVALATALGCASAKPPDAKSARGAETGAPVGVAAAGAAARSPIATYLEKQAQQLGAIPGADVARKDDALIVSLESGTVYDANSAALSAGGTERIRALARTLQDFPKERIIVKGHTDSEGDERANQRLSEDRADSVRNLLVAEGVTPSRVTAVGLGATLPVASNSTAEGRQQNRRVEIELRPEDEVLQGDASQ